MLSRFSSQFFVAKSPLGGCVRTPETILYKLQREPLGRTRVNTLIYLPLAERKRALSLTASKAIVENKLRVICTARSHYERTVELDSERNSIFISKTLPQPTPLSDQEAELINRTRERLFDLSEGEKWWLVENLERRPFEMYVAEQNKEMMASIIYEEIGLDLESTLKKAKNSVLGRDVLTKIKTVATIDASAEEGEK